MTYRLVIYRYEERKTERYWSGTPEDLDRYLDDLGAHLVIVHPCKGGQP